ncbi:MAG TPA: NADPH-dependent FMN reductase [Bordetella sp.]|jgi:FMN reductase|nr:NADPH-dependent FMN reductase [Bordetella sp.]
MSILMLAGSPSSRSRSSALLRHVGLRLTHLGLQVREVGLLDIPANVLVEGQYTSPDAAHFRARVSAASAVVVATPIYKASFSGGLKAMLDLLDEKALADKVVLPIATGGSAAHLLALEYGLKPVLSALGARHILGGIYATETQVRVDSQGQARIDDDVALRLDDAAEQLFCHVSLALERSVLPDRIPTPLSREPVRVGLNA